MDCFSNLPDEVLCHILSFLPTKYAALTSILSKRWLNLWKLVPNLNIDDTEFLHPEQGKSERVEIKQSFVDFVDNVLALQGDSPIEKFTLKSITCIHPDIVNRWIRSVLSRGVSDLDLFIDFDYDDWEEEGGYYLPKELFISKTLVKLSITCDIHVDLWYSVIRLPMLKSLYIDSDSIFFDKMEKFFDSFPVLEELRMANMDWYELDVTISSLSLRKLILHGTGYESFINPKSISFDIPNLVYLSYADLVAEDYPLINMEKLVEVRIDLILTPNQIKRIRAPDDELLEVDEEGDVVLKFSNVVKLMNGIQNVRKLSFSESTLEVFSLYCESMPIFNNLKLLSLENDEGRGWQAMPALLRHCPHLETLIITGLLHHVTNECGDACDCISQEDKGRSLASCPVKMIEIQGFRATRKEMRIIKHFLNYLPCLKLMNVYVEEADPTRMENPEIAGLIDDMFELYNEFSSCDLQLMVSDNLDKKWREQGSWFYQTNLKT